MSISRRGFLSFAWREKKPDTPEDDRYDEEIRLPPEFDGAMLRMEGMRLGLDVDAMSERELARAVLAAMRAAAPGGQE